MFFVKSSCFLTFHPPAKISLRYFAMVFTCVFSSVGCTLGSFSSSFFLFLDAATSSVPCDSSVFPAPSTVDLVACFLLLRCLLFTWGLPGSCSMTASLFSWCIDALEFIKLHSDPKLSLAHSSHLPNPDHPNLPHIHTPHLFSTWPIPFPSPLSKTDRNLHTPVDSGGVAIFLFFFIFLLARILFYLCPCLCPYPFPYRDDCSAGLSFSQSLLHPSRQRKQNIAIFSQAILENKNIISNLLQRSTFEVYQCYPRLIFRLSESSVLSTRLFLHLNPFSWRCWAGPRKFHGFFTFAIRTLIAWTSFIWSDFRGRSWPRWWQWHFFWTNISKRLRLHIVPTHSWHNKSIKQWNIIWTQILKACSFFSLRIKKMVLQMGKAMELPIQPHFSWPL